MIKVTATAIIHSISPVIDIPSKTGGQPFQKRELILNDSWSRDGKEYSNFVVIEFSGDAMFQLDNFVPGQRVNVEAYVNGREHNGRVYNTINGRSVVFPAPEAPAQPAPAAYPQAPAPQYQAFAYPQQAAPSYAPQQAAPAYPQQAVSNYPQAPAPPAQPQPAAPLGPSGLPF